MSTSKKMAPKQAKVGKTVLVTGATSGIGRMLIEKLLAKNYEVRVLLRKYPNEHVEWKELPSGVKVFVADVKSSDTENRKVMIEASRGVSILFHLAAATRNYHTRYSHEKVETNVIINTNVIGTENVLQAYADANPTQKLKFIYGGSTSVYGNKREGEVLTEESEAKPRGAYGESKYMAEQVIKAFEAANRRISYTILRIAVVYGKGYEGSFMKIFQLLKDRKLRFVGGGKNHLTLINVEDVANAMIKVAENDKCENETYNLTDGVAYTQRDLMTKAAKMIGVQAPTKSIPHIIARIGSRTRGISEDEFSFLTSDRVVSIDKIKKEVGFKPSVTIDSAGSALAKEFLKRQQK